jgi:hypothetical protein
VRQYTITSAYDPTTVAGLHPITTVTDVLAMHNAPGTVVVGHGSHPKWGVEPVVVVTIYTAEGYLPYDVAHNLAINFNQECVVVARHDDVTFDMVEGPKSYQKG